MSRSDDVLVRFSDGTDTLRGLVRVLRDRRATFAEHTNILIRQLANDWGDITLADFVYVNDDRLDLALVLMYEVFTMSSIEVYELEQNGIKFGTLRVYYGILQYEKRRRVMGGI